MRGEGGEKTAQERDFTDDGARRSTTRTRTVTVSLLFGAKREREIPERNARCVTTAAAAAG